MKLHLYTFPSKLRLKIYTFPRNQHLYFIPVLIYTLIKVKSKLREEKKWIRQTDQPICRSPPMILPIFLLAAKSSWLHLAFSWHRLVKIPLIFVPSQRIENRWTSDRKKGVFPVGSDSSEKCGKTDGFGPEKQARKGFSTVQNATLSHSGCSVCCIGK